MTTADLTALLNDNLNNSTTRLVLADALEEIGRDEEAELCRRTDQPILVSYGAIVEALTYSVSMCDGPSTETEIFLAADDDEAEQTAAELTRDWIREGDWGEDGVEIDAHWRLSAITYRVTCDGWRRVGDGPEPDGTDNNYDHWYYLDHVGAFVGRDIDCRDPEWPTEAEARRWAGLASADAAADLHGIVPVLAVEAVEEEIAEGDVTVTIEPDHEVLIRRAVGRWGSAADRCCGTDPDDHDWTSEGEGGLDENPGVWSTGGTSMAFASHCRVCGLRRSEYTCGSQKNPGDHDTVCYEMPDSWCEECQSEQCDCEEEA